MNKTVSSSKIWRHVKFVIYAVVVALAVLALSGCPEKELAMIQFVIQPSTHETAEVTEHLIYEMSRLVRPNQVVEFSILKGNKIVSILHSGTANRQVIQNLHYAIDSDNSTVNITPTPSSPEDLIPGVQRFRDWLKVSPPKQQMRFVLVTPGTDNPRIINQIREVFADLTDQDLSTVQVLVIGLEADKWLSFSNAFSPIGTVVQFANQDDGQWLPLLRKL